MKKLWFKKIKVKGLKRWKIFPSSILGSFVGLISKLKQDRLIGEKQINFIYNFP